MKLRTLFRYTGSVACLAMLVTGCNGTGSSSSVPSGLAPGGLSPAVLLGRLPPGMPDPANWVKAQSHPHRLWISPDAARKPRLLFVSDASRNTVTLFTMRSLKVLGQVGGFAQPFGECADQTGQVWVADDEAQNLTKFDRSLEEVGKLDDSAFGVPVSCAVNVKNGDLAVVNEWDGTGPGNIAIFHHGGGHGSIITDPDIFHYFWAAYDNNNTLWIDGVDAHGAFRLASCNTSSCTTIPVRGGQYGRGIRSPGFVAWSPGGKQLYVADARCREYTKIRAFCIYPVSSSGDLGTAIFLNDFYGNLICEAMQGAITNHQSKAMALAVRAVHTTAACYFYAMVGRYRWPSGTERAERELYLGGEPTGAAISVK